jgi:hypothetical protein
MSFVSNILDRRRVWRTLHNYPVYSPPFRDAEAVLSKSEIAANFKYFLEQKERRVGYLTTYLSQFSLALRLEREGLFAVDDWLRRFSGYLVPRRDALYAFVEHEPEWNCGYLGLNVINDVAIFAGDYIISKNKNVRWDVYYGDGTKYDYEECGFGLPCLFGLLNAEYRGRPYSIQHEIFQCCSSGRYRLIHGGIGGVWDIPGELVRQLDYLTDPKPPAQGRFRLSIPGHNRHKL